MKKLSLTVLRNSAFGVAAQLAIKVLSFLFSVFIIRRLGVGTYGQYTAVLAFGATFAIIGDLGLSPYAVREVARWRDTPDGHARAERLYANVLLMRLLLSAFTALLLVGAAWLTGRPLIMIGAIALSTMGLMLYAVQGSSDAILSGFERLDLASGARVSNQVMFVGLGAVVLLAGASYFGLILANIAGVALMTYICWHGVRRLGVRLGRPAVREWWPLLRASLPFAAIGFALGLSYKFDSVLLNIFRSDQETGYYNSVYNLVFSAAMFSNAFNTALYPSLVRQSHSHPESLPRIYERVFRYLMIMALPIAGGVWALADRLVPFLYTENYAPAAPALAILIWAVPLMYASEFLGYIVVIAGKESRVARAVISSTALNVAANSLLVPRFGFFAAALMTVLTEAVLVAQYLWLLRDLLKHMNWNYILIRPLLAAGSMVLGVWLLRGTLPLLANVAIGGIIYGLALLSLGALGKDEIRFVRSLHSENEVSLPESL